MSEPDSSSAAPRTITFRELGISPHILRSLDQNRLRVPTPIQAQAIPLAAVGSDLIGIAQTGTGKTMAFGIPTIQRLMLQGGKAIVLVPTRELAVQVKASIDTLAVPLKLATVLVIGGERMNRQIRELKEDWSLIVATPGRLNDLLDRKKVELSEVKVAILDEADRMLDMGFLPQIETILQRTPVERQTLLFSATMPAEIERLASQYQNEPQRIEVARAGSTADKVSQEIIVVPKHEKLAMLEKVLLEHRNSTSLIFVRTKLGVSDVIAHIRTLRIPALELHSDRSLRSRLFALDALRRKRTRVLVVTDIAARGLDVVHVGLVVNYDLPENAEDYVHRIGRTGRAGRSGVAISLAEPDQERLVHAINKVTSQELVPSERSTVGWSEFSGSKRGKGGRGGSRRRGPMKDAPAYQDFGTSISGPDGFSTMRSNKRRPKFFDND